MKTSTELIEKIGKFESRYDQFDFVELCWRGVIGYRARNTDSLLVKIHEMSMTYFVGDIAAYTNGLPYSCLPHLTFYLQPSTDGQTNIDMAFMEKLSELNIISNEKVGY